MGDFPGGQLPTLAPPPPAPLRAPMHMRHMITGNNTNLNYHALRLNLY